MPVTTQVWAHRGASLQAPENTMAAFALAVQLGADGIELDVHQSKDGQLMVIHDERIDRTSNSQGRVVDYTFDELRRLDFCNGKEAYRGKALIPTLPEVYELIKPTRLCINVEIKCDVVIYWGIWEKLIALERQMGMQGRILYSSFNHYALAELRKCDPEARIGLLYDNALVDPWVYAGYMKADALHPHYLAALQCPGLIQGCKEHGVALHPWTADDPLAIEALYQAQVEAVITNAPDVALALRQATT